uniref:V-type proton ATPase catalytic subunit A n=1 Tax=Rhizophora mucronata TaxID=61149 RepID=A0A2P2QF39_RHIMU
MLAPLPSPSLIFFHSLSSPLFGAVKFWFLD